VRVLIDPNVYISFLLASPESRSPIVAILRAAANQEFDLVLPLEAIDELGRTVREKRHLSRRISVEDLASLIDNIMDIAVVASPLEGAIPRVVRDAKDDYFVAHAVRSSVDCLVTGDKDLLALGEHQGIQFVGPGGFALEQLR
jgi:putative PIN family toxin of toxin-antitoxin system